MTDSESAIIVATDGSGDYKTVQDAIDSIPDDSDNRVIIYIRQGIYKQKIRITKPRVSLIGDSPQTTILTYDDHALKTFPAGERMNTFNSYSIYIGGSDFSAENITFENSSGPGDVMGQAVAAYVDADRAVFKKCRFLGCQDTLFTGPLPHNPVPLGLNLKHPALGYGEEYPGLIRQYYEDCFIRGDIDFIFGSATAVFNRCEIFSNHCRETGYIAAASTPPDQQYGYVFLNCHLTGDAETGSVYLGRPWRSHAKTAYINCRMGRHIAPEGWHNWEKPERQNTVTYSEFNSTGPGAERTKRTGWARLLTSNEAEAYTVENILTGDDGWRFGSVPPCRNGG